MTPSILPSIRSHYSSQRRLPSLHAPSRKARNSSAPLSLKSRARISANSAAVSIQCDLLNPEAPRDILKTAQDAFGSQIDILVNNAAMITDKYVQDITIDHFDEVFHLNVRAPMLMVQTLLPHMRRPGMFLAKRVIANTLADNARSHHQHRFRWRSRRLSYDWVLCCLEISSGRLHSCVGFRTR